MEDNSLDLFTFLFESDHLLKKKRKPFLPLTTSLQKNAQNSTLNPEKAPPWRIEKLVQLDHCGPHSVDLLAMKFAAALCYFASSCLCKIGLEIWQLIKTVQQNKRLAKNIRKVGLKKAVKAGCMQNIWLSLTRDSCSAISCIPMPLRHKQKGKLYKACVTSSTEISQISKA